MREKKRPFGKLLMILAIAFFYLPIVYMVVFSFNEGKSLTSFTGFSLRWYQHMMESGDMMEALYTTFSVAVLATFVSTVVGTITAIGLSKSRKIIRNIMEQVNNLPMMNPEIVTAIGLMLLFITFRVEKGYMTMLLAHIAFCIPYVILSVMPKIRSLDPNLADAAMDLGATPWRALTKVIVPQITPGIVSGALIAFTMSVDDFIISYFVTGRGVKNLSIVVYTMSKRVNPSINAVSTLVVVIITIILVLINVVPLITEKRGTKETIGKRRGLVPVVAVCMAVVVLVISLNLRGAGGGDRPYEGQTLHIYNWGEYTGENIIPDFINLSDLRFILTSLIKEHVSVKDITYIFEQINDYAEDSSKIDLLKKIRLTLSRQICNNYINEDGVMSVFELTDKTIDSLVENFDETDDVVRINGEFAEKIAEKINKKAEQLGLEESVKLIVPMEYRHLLFTLLSNYVRDIAVLAREEIGCNCQLEILASI